ncbi:hypothetical protein [Candidatus Berkiella aquae]|uniref:Acireductone dioxygenase n=1 Tax=Candidatus Berkiella aquae TaxID=295108 RepID=A0A0Q9YP13_9GAMM|nr:hypothetical protein [Candidatus Berkiella aquae]MCS5711585.1 hypothetical protein [Candidatus Berkiella aquae]
MSKITIFSNTSPEAPLFTSENQSEIREQLHRVGIRFEQWSTHPEIGPHSSHEAILEAYDEPIQRLVREVGYQSWDVVALYSDHPDKTVLRQKFLKEHTHKEDEVRFFVAGSGLFTLHIDGKVYSVLCERGDFISVPAKMYHWFDMGPSPHFIAIRLFNNPDGWIAEYSGSEIAESFPKMS